MVVGDWGTAWFNGWNGLEFLGGTPGYAGPNTFNLLSSRDLFSFARLALDLAVDKAGKSFDF